MIFEKKISLYLFLWTNLPTFLLYLTPRDHELNKLESTPPEFAFAQVTVFWPICFLSRRFFKDFVLLVYIPMYTFDPTLEATPPEKDRKKR